MRIQFVSENLCATEEEIAEGAPWAAVITEVDGGFWVFESIADAERFQNQQ